MIEKVMIIMKRKEEEEEKDNVLRKIFEKSLKKMGKESIVEGRKRRKEKKMKIGIDGNIGGLVGSMEKWKRKKLKEDVEKGWGDDIREEIMKVMKEFRENEERIIERMFRKL